MEDVQPASCTNVDKIIPMIWCSYFSFFQDVKSANTKVFKDFYYAEKMEKNKSDCKNYFHRSYSATLVSNVPGEH